MYQDATCKPWNSRQWAPGGYATREEFETKTKEERAGGNSSTFTDQGVPKGTADEKQ